MPYEIYMNIGNYQGIDLSNYEVSNLGNVRNAKTKKVLKPIKHVTNTGYMHLDVVLSDTNHKKHTIIIARLVISTFKANPDNKPQVNHINEDPTDNRLNNLQWVTPKENNDHGTRNTRMVATMKANGTYTKISDIMKDNKKRSIPVYCITNNTIYSSATEAARQLNLDQGSITKCLKGKFKQTKGYQFKYYQK